MYDNLAYLYEHPSQLEKQADQSNLTLAQYSEVEKKTPPCFFWGALTQPYPVSRCLIALSNVVRSSFSLSPFEAALLKDPIVTAGNEHIRFEGFSHCAGVYARVDVAEEGHKGRFIENGTTNVDFNQEMISALGGVQRADDLFLSVGQKEVQVVTGGQRVIERKVPLPNKWIKSLTSVQHYLSESELHCTLARLQAMQLFKTLPKGAVKADYYLMKRGNRYSFSPMQTDGSVLIGGIQRLHLLTPLLPLIDQLKFFVHPEQQSFTVQLYFGAAVFSLTLSRNAWRGFSGEGALLEALLEDIPEQLIQNMDNYSYANQVFDQHFITQTEIDSGYTIENLAAKLAAMGLLGFDLDNRQYFYRRLPFKLSRILSLNPRLKGVEKLLAQDQVKILKNDGQQVEARVQGSGVSHWVVLGAQQKCTCVWFSQHQGKRGDCKHILAVKKKIK